MMMAVWKFAPALAAGNTVVLKPRAGVVGLDLQYRACGPDGGATGLRLRVDQHHIPLVAEMPHGGFKHSGYGKDLSMYGFEDYTRIKHVMQYHGFEG
jgi:acyl-CoA reductase-like NAD-dependent aldehyde dehydrogenase